MLEVPHAFHDWHRVALAQMATEDVMSTQVQDGHLKSDQSWHTYTQVIMSWTLCEDNNMGISNRITGGTHRHQKIVDSVSSSNTHSNTKKWILYHGLKPNFFSGFQPIEKKNTNI